MWLHECAAGLIDDGTFTQGKERLCALWSKRECESFLSIYFTTDYYGAKKDVTIRAGCDGNAYDPSAEDVGNGLPDHTRNIARAGGMHRTGRSATVSLYCIAALLLCYLLMQIIRVRLMSAARRGIQVSGQRVLPSSLPCVTS